MEADRKVALRAAKLAALVRDHIGASTPTFAPSLFPGGAALRAGDEGWVLLDERALRAFGGALVWSRHHRIPRLNVVVDDTEIAGHLARRASYFDMAVSVWLADGRTLVAALPSSLPVVGALADDVAAFASFMRLVGAEPVIEHGYLSGEVYGLEVCRAFRDAHSGVARIEVGVGSADREAFRLIHGDDPPPGAAIEIVERIAAHRRPGAPGHALNRLAAERRFRHALIDAPSLVGARSLAASAPPLPRENLKDPSPCVARGVDSDGTPLVVVCAAGVDFDVVPVAADARAASNVAESRLVIALAERDMHPALVDLAGCLRQPADLRAVKAP